MRNVPDNVQACTGIAADEKLIHQKFFNVWLPFDTARPSQVSSSPATPAGAAHLKLLYLDANRRVCFNMSVPTYTNGFNGTIYLATDFVRNSCERR